MANVVKSMKKGKQKIAYDKPIQSKTKRQVTFTKRRKGLFKKAGELSIMCGAQVAVVTFSSAGKLFPFGHPSPDAVVRRFINDHQTNNVDNHHHNPLIFDEISSEERVVSDEAAPCSSRKNNGHGHGRGRGRGFWWEEPIEGLGLVELERFKTALEGLREQVAFKIDYEVMNNVNHSDHGTSIVTSIGDAQDFDFGFMDGINDDNNCVGDQTSFRDSSNNNNGCASDYGFSSDDPLLDILLNDYC